MSVNYVDDYAIFPRLGTFLPGAQKNGMTGWVQKTGEKATHVPTPLSASGSFTSSEIGGHKMAVLRIMQQ